MTVAPEMVRHLAGAAVSVELETPDMTLNIGPQHPSTHGVLRLVARVDGERAFDVHPVIGYMHRGYEKLSEVRTYPQITALINRIDWVSGYANEIPFIVAAERLMGVEPPERAQYIRLILTEMARISSHLVFQASYPLELGAATPLFFALRDRERVLDLIESVTGGRFHPNFNRIGGVKPAVGAGPTTRKTIQDLPAGFLSETREAMDRVLSTADELEDLVAGNEIVLARTKGIGILPPEVAVSYGVSGPNLRASGVGFDLRTVSDYLPYDRFEFEIPTGQAGDCWDRWWVRLEEIRQFGLDHPPGGGFHPVGADPGQGAPHHQGSRRRDLRAGRESQGRDGLLRGLRRGAGSLPSQDPLGVLLQHLHPALGAGRWAGARHHRHHGIAGLRAGRRGPMRAPQNCERVAVSRGTRPPPRAAVSRKTALTRENRRGPSHARAHPRHHLAEVRARPAGAGPGAGGRARDLTSLRPGGAGAVREVFVTGESMSRACDVFNPSGRISGRMDGVFSRVPGLRLPGTRSGGGRA